MNQIVRLSSSELARFLSVVSLELTISAREIYVPGSMDVEDPSRLRALNECQHFLLGILRRVLFVEEVDVSSLIESFSSLLGDKQVGEALQAASRRAMLQVQPSRTF
jgi:hypothetical protein